MKYTIHGLQQEKLISLGLTNDDALVLSVIKDMYSSASIESKVIDEERYIWINQNSLIFEQIPILGTKRTLLRKMKKFEELGLIKRKTIFNKNGVKGSFGYISITEKLDYLTEYTVCQNVTEGYDKLSPGVCQNVTGGMTKCHSKDYPIKDYPIKDYPIKDSNINNISKDILCSTFVERVIESWNSLCLTSKLKTIKAGTKRHTMLKARVKQYSEDEIIQAINNIKESSFLMGRVKDFEITFDWFIRPNNFIKVLENNYKDKGDKNGFGNSNSRIEGKESGISGTTAPGWEGVDWSKF
ncbi:hypothetical protein [Clostridium thermobutyricum]|uniref:hypothetical protein n=1 Tax=Clostridium thermobutyricum TaxID=29372 RepID=UPI003F522F05